MPAEAILLVLTRKGLIVFALLIHAINWQGEKNDDDKSQKKWNEREG